MSQTIKTSPSGTTRQPKITKRMVDAIKPGDRDVFAWDPEIRGFGVRCKPTGNKSYVVQFRNAHGRSCRVTIGRCNVLTADEARREARLILADAQRGDDRAAERRADREAPTVADLAERFLTDHAEVHKKPRSVEEDRRNLRLHVLPVLGRKVVKEVTRADIDKLHRSLKDMPTGANRTLALISIMFTKAEEWGWRPDYSNPAARVKRYRETPRERFLSANELARLGAALAEAEDTDTELPSVVAAIRLLVFTGARKSEILGLRWRDVDTERGVLRLPDSKTGPKWVELNAPALEVLAGLGSGEPDDYVLRGLKAGQHLVGLQGAWVRIRERAGILDVRLHDLRHSFASIAVGLGEGLPIVGKLLGHTQAATTQRYAHFAADPVKRATERVGAAILGMMAGTGGEVVPLKNRK